MTLFTDLGLAEALGRAVAARGYETPTPIQAAVVPAILDGADVIGLAQTGTGKTAAFVLPMLQRIAAAKAVPGPRTCTVLILAPTRELAAQIADCARAYGRFLSISVALVVGGAKAGPQIRALARGVDLLVATPGRLLDHMQSNALHLDRTGAIVLDEADRMFDLGFAPALRRILSAVPRPRQTVLMSATMSRQVEALAREVLVDPRRISVAGAERPTGRIKQSVVSTTGAGKRAVLTTLLSAPDVARAIVFTRTKGGADKIQLHLANAGLAACALHGDKSQGQRASALAAFKSGRMPILVATDIAARGIDVDGVSHVFNYEMPDAAEVYVHRIGRTARAGRSGVAISLCEPSERRRLRDIERLIGSTLQPLAA